MPNLKQLIPPRPPDYDHPKPNLTNYQCCSIAPPYAIDNFFKVAASSPNQNPRLATKLNPPPRRHLKPNLTCDRVLQHRTSPCNRQLVLGCLNSFQNWTTRLAAKLDAPPQRHLNHPNPNVWAQVLPSSTYSCHRQLVLSCHIFPTPYTPCNRARSTSLTSL